MRALLVCDRGVGVSSEPDFCGPVFRGHGDEGHVDNEGEGDVWVIEVCVIVRGLRFWRRVWCWGQGGVAGYEAEGWVWTEGCGCYLGDDWVYQLFRNTPRKRVVLAF